VARLMSGGSHQNQAVPDVPLISSEVKHEFLHLNLIYYAFFA